VVFESQNRQITIIEYLSIGCLIKLDKPRILVGVLSSDWVWICVPHKGTNILRLAKRFDF